MHIIVRSLPDISGTVRESGMGTWYEETPYAIFINGRHATTVLLSPGDQKEYMTGFLFTEQYVDSLEDIESIRVEQNRISVITRNIFTRPEPKKTILSGCGGAVSYIDTAKLPVITLPHSVSGTDLDGCVRDFLQGERQSRKGPVTAYLCQRGEILIAEHDVGGEQVLDRIIGAALVRKIDLSTFMCICSMTITSEIVRKCLMAWIPLILTTASITHLAAEIGQKNGVCMGVIRGDDLIVYSHPERIS
jgi:FdhD protein